MTGADRVLAECAAAPDDDGPRLVWADLVGGERGELVVLQCDLARGGLSPRDVASRRRRERELLERYAVEWAESVARVAKRWSFRRGFVEAALVHEEEIDVGVLARWPLLRSLTVELTIDEPPSIDEQLGAYLETLHAFGVIGSAPRRAAWLAEVAKSVRFRELRALAIDGLDPEQLSSVLAILGRAPIEQLRVTNHSLEDVRLRLALAAAPGLRALEVTSALPFELVADLPLRALRIGGLADRDRASFERYRTDQLRHLSILTQPPSWALDRLAQFSELRSLEIAIEPPMLDRVIEAVGDRVERLVVTMIGGANAELTATVARGELIEGELQLGIDGGPPDHDTELLHASPDAMSALGPTCYARFPPATIVRVDGEPQLWNIPPLPLDAGVFLGRSTYNVIVLQAETVARRHASLRWRDDHYEIVDMRSSNGTIVNFERVERRALADGDMIQLGAVVLRYFFGVDARARGEAALGALLRAAAFRRVIGILRDPRCDKLAVQVSLDTTHLPAVANALVDRLVRQVFADARYATYHERPTLRALAPIRDAATRDAARLALTREHDLGSTSETTHAVLQLIDELERAGESERDAIWLSLFHEAGPMSMAVTRAQSAGILELPDLMAELLASLP